MSVPNSLPVSLSSVIAEFGGVNGPRNLGAYRAGAGLVPSGTKGGSAAIPTPNGLIPSSFPLNLGSFPGSKKELTVTQYWPYKDNYHRNIYYRSSNPPATAANNDDQTAHWNNYPTSYYVNNQVLWQHMTFSNLNNAALPDSGQCTVFYMVNASNTSFSNTMSAGTSLSIRANDATGASHHVSPIATGKLNFTTDGTQSDSCIAWATYNFSMKKITDLYCALTDTSSQGAWDELIILPGAKKVTSYVVTPNNSGFDTKPSNPINPDEVVVGMKFDGGGNYEIQYQNQTFPNGLRQDGWWYHNAGFDIEANCTTGPVTLTTQVPQDYTPSNVWIIIGDNVGGTYATGVNPVWPGYNYFVTTSGTASFTVKRNGGVTASKNGVTQDLPSQTVVTCPENWYMGTSLTSMPGDNYWVKVTPSGSTTNMPSGPTGYVHLSSDQTWTWTGDGTNCAVDINIATDAAGSNNKYLGVMVLGAASGGGGGGGGSVSVTAYMPATSKQAGQMLPDDPLLIMNAARNGYFPGAVVSNRISIQNLVRLVSESGIRLTCSDNTPLTLKDGTSINSTQALGVELPVQDINGFRWEKIVELQEVGEGAVATIFCDDQCYAAGDEEGRYIWTHNVNNVKV